MPVVRRERHRSNSNSPKLPARTQSPRTTAAAGHRLMATGSSGGGSGEMMAGVKIAPVLSSSSSSRATAAAFAPARNAINNNPSASPPSAGIDAAAGSDGSSGSSSPSISTGFPATLSLGMSLRNHTRNILAEQRQQQQQQQQQNSLLSSSSRSVRENGLSGARRSGDVDFPHSDYSSSASSLNSDLTSRSSAGGRQMYVSNSATSTSSGSNHHHHGLSASSRSDPCIRLFAEPPDDFSEEKDSRRKRRCLMNMIDTNVPQHHPAFYEFGPYFGDHFSSASLPVHAASAVSNSSSGAATASSTTTSSSLNSRAPSRLSSSSSSSDGTVGGASRTRRSTRKRVRSDRLVDHPSTLYSVNGHLVATGPGHPGMPYPPPFNAFCQAAALGHACSANHVVHLNAGGALTTVPHLCCNVAMCPMQQRACPAAGHSSATSGQSVYANVPYSTGQSQQMHSNPVQTRHSQGMSQSIPSSQSHRASQPYLPQDMLPGSHPYRSSFGHQMMAASMDQSGLSHHGAMPHVLSARQYPNGGGSSGHTGQVTSESLANMYGLAGPPPGSGWAPRRRMTENVTPASQLSAQQNSPPGRGNPGVQFHPYDHYYPRFHPVRSSQNPMSVGGPIYYNSNMEMPSHVGDHDQHYELIMSISDRVTEGKPKGLTKQEIEKIRQRRFSGEKSEHGQVQCVICICDFEPKQALRQLPCCHEFHSKCVDKWLKSNRTCPICRGDASTHSKKSKHLY